MKKIKNEYVILGLIILLILKYLLKTHEVISIIISLLGLLLVGMYYIYFNDIFDKLKIKYKNICLAIICISNILTVAINASVYVSSLVLTNNGFMILVSLFKYLNLLVMLYFVNTAYTEKKYRILSILFVAVAYLNVFEILINIEAILEIIAIIINYGLEKNGRIINLQEKDNK